MTITVERSTPLLVALGAGGDPEAPVATTLDGCPLGLAERSSEVA